MSGIDYLADTNAVLYFLSGNECMKPYVSSHFAFSVISEMELLSFPKITEDEESRIRGFLDASSCVVITDSIKNRTIELRRAYRIKVPDAIIAASAIESNLALIIADTGFERIKELRLELIAP